MSSTDVVARSLDLSARGVDLLTALTETANSPHSVVHVAMEIGRWLGREKLNERELQFCLEKARGLVIPNLRGNQFYDSVLTGTRERTVGSLFTQPSGALGRHMVNDPYLCWMTSTIACLFEFHSENFISDVLCSFIMQAHLSEDGKPVTEYQLAWHPVRLRLKPVLEKIVSSIWYNVVNSGIIKSGQLGSNESLPLPRELKEVCPRGHNIESHTLGLVFSQLRKPRPQVIIESDHVISNLALWLIYHFNGHLRVTVSSKIIFDETLGLDKTPQSHFQSLEGDLAVIETQHTEDTQNLADEFTKHAEEPGSQVQVQTDTSIIKSDYILVSAGSGRYKLLMRVISNSHSRLVDPARAMIKTSQPFLSFSCKHSANQDIQTLGSTPALKLYSFDELLGRWPEVRKGTEDDSLNPSRQDDEFPVGEYHRVPTGRTPPKEPDPYPTFRVSYILDSYLKYNIALALTFDDVTLINHETACLACTIEKGKSADATNGSENLSHNRWIIYRSKMPNAAGRPSEQRHLQGGSRKRIKASLHGSAASRRDDTNMEVDG